jgi:hypothetical protein
VASLSLEKLLNQRFRTLTVGFQLAVTKLLAAFSGPCRLSKNGEIVYNDDCTVKEKAGEGRETFFVKFDNGKVFRFSGPNRQNLRIEDNFANASKVLFEDKRAKGIFSWSDGNSTYKLVVKTGGAASEGSSGNAGGGLVLGPSVPDLHYLVGKSPGTAALGFVIRGTKSVTEVTAADPMKCQR